MDEQPHKDDCVRVVTLFEFGDGTFDVLVNNRVSKELSEARRIESTALRDFLTGVELGDDLQAAIERKLNADT